MRLVRKATLSPALCPSLWRLSAAPPRRPSPNGGGARSTPKPPVPLTTYNVTVTANPTAAHRRVRRTPSTVTVDVRRTDNGQPPPDLTAVTLTTTLGGFGAGGSGPQTVTLQLVNGRAQAALFPGASDGHGDRARPRSAAAPARPTSASARPATFFVSSVDAERRQTRRAARR